MIEGEVKISTKVYEKEKVSILVGGEDIELIKNSEIFKKSVEDFCKNVLTKENIIDSGNFAHVFRGDKDHNLCYKKTKPFASPPNNVHRESELLESVYGLSDKVVTPYPLLSAEMYRGKKDYVEKTGLIVMEHLDAISLRDIISPEKAERKKEFPKSFNIETFFASLVDFVNKMHSEKNIYHCDLMNLGNIMVEIETGKPCVIDFGQASDFTTDDKHDYYGRSIIEDIKREDKDLEAVEKVKNMVKKYLNIDKNQYF